MKVRGFQLILPINIEVMIPVDDSVRLLNEMLEKLDYSKLYDCYSRLGRPATSPKMLFKVVAYGYMNNIYSSRRIEKSCKCDINFIWLLAGEKAPDHNTINRFRSGHLTSVIEDLFYQLVTLLGNMGEIAYGNIFIDGTKIEANANKYSFVWKKSIQKHEVRLEDKIKLLIEEINRVYKTSFKVDTENPEVFVLADILEFLNSQRTFYGIEFVFGKGKRKSPLQRYIEKTEGYLNSKKKYNDYNEIFDGRNSFSKTDHDATFMHMKEDHMRNSQLKPGYNVQIGVEGEYIVGAQIFSERSDQLTFIPFLQKLEENLPCQYKNVVADAGYESEENYVFLESKQQKSFIKPSNYEISKKSSYKKKISLRENMNYKIETDEYTCHNNKRLKFIGERAKKSKTGYISNVKIYECESCDGCDFKSQCTKAKGNRTLQVAEEFARLREVSLANIISKEGIILRVNRSIQVEGAFGVLKEDYGFIRFLLRGKKMLRQNFCFCA